MKQVIWNRRHSVGIAELDVQHEQLARTLNDLSDAIRKRHGHDVVTRLLDTMVEQTREHFATEESLMTAQGFTRSLPHAREHERLLAQASELQRRALAGSDPTAAALPFLRAWLLNHMVQGDKEYSEFIRAHGLS